MIKSLLVSLTGSDADQVALETALLAGGPFRAHFDCFHVRPGPASDFANLLVSDVVDLVQERDRLESIDARMTFDMFRKRFDIPVAETPEPPEITLAWREVFGDQITQTIAAARYHDLTVFGRSREFTPLSPDVIGEIVLACGKPVLIAPQKAPSRLGQIIVIAWKNCAEAARAVTAAAPLIHEARKVVVLTAAENGKDLDRARNSAEKLCQQLRWSRARAEVQITDTGDDAADAVFETAKAVDADLVVSGAYGHNRVREIAFGGFTDSALRRAPLPVLMCH